MQPVISPLLGGVFILSHFHRPIAKLWTDCLGFQRPALVHCAQSCPTLCDPTDCSLPGSSVHGVFLARIREWVAMPSSKGSSWPRDQTQVSCIAGRFFTIWATRRNKRIMKQKAWPSKGTPQRGNSGTKNILRLSHMGKKKKETYSFHLGNW